MVKIKRVYDSLDAHDGYRILIDRLWPRGVKKEDANADAWMKGVAPSPALRKWYGHDPEKWQEFSKKYLAELKKEPDAVGALLNCVQKYKTVTLLYAAKDENHTHALVLQHYIKSLLKQ